MIIKNITVSNFRNYDYLTIDFHPKVNIIVGDNAQGKTNLLESIYVLGLTKSHRSFIDDNLIRKSADKAKIKGTIGADIFDTTLEVIIDEKQKLLSVDQTQIKRVIDYIANMNLIIFYPEDLELVKGSPNVRRRFLNLEITQIYNNYLVYLSDYNKLLKMRNELLKKIQKKQEVDLSYFGVLTNYFLEKAVLIYQYRDTFIKKLDLVAQQIYKDLSSSTGFSIKYKPSLAIPSFGTQELKQFLMEKCEQMYAAETKSGVSLIGPHRDDFEIMLDQEPLKTHGSQGQQRMAVLALKLAEIELLKREDKVPILLLDDVFSELDEKKKNNLLMYITNNIQTIITTTDLLHISDEILKESKVIHIRNGKLLTDEEVL